MYANVSNVTWIISQGDQIMLFWLTIINAPPQIAHNKISNNQENE